MHGRVAADTHNDLRSAVETLSGGLLFTIYAKRYQTVRASGGTIQNVSPNDAYQFVKLWSAGPDL